MSPPKIEASEEKKIDPLLREKETSRPFGFTWKRDDEDDVALHVDTSQTFLTSVRSDAKSLFKILGYKIDLTDKVCQFKDAYAQNTIQARTNNSILSLYAKFKVSALGQLLTLLGVSAEDLQMLQKNAVIAALDENETLMRRNLNNVALMEIVGAKKAKKAKAMFREAASQLNAQRVLLGKPAFSEEDLTQMTMDEIQLLIEDFEKEAANLSYLLDHLRLVN